MNSPYNGKFKVTQTFNSKHDGLDLVGIDSKKVRSTINGIVERAGWENANNKKQGFGLYVRIKRNNSNDRYYFGHLQSLNVSFGQKVNITDVIGTEGATGNASGSHVHYCIRGDASKREIKNVASISKIPNKLGIYDDGYRESSSSNSQYKVTTTTLNMRQSASYGKNIIKVLPPNTRVQYLGLINGWAKISYNNLIGFVGPKYLK